MSRYGWDIGNTAEKQNFTPGKASRFAQALNSLFAHIRPPKATYAEVLLPLMVPGSFTYVVPAEWEAAVAVGKRVLVPVGRKKIYTGVVERVFQSETNPLGEGTTLRPINEVLDDLPVVTPRQLELMHWMAFYYFCYPGQVLKALLPTGLKLESRLLVEPAATFELVEEELTDEAYLVMEALQQEGMLELEEVAQILEVNDPLPRLRKWAELGWFKLRPVVHEKYREKTVRVPKISPAFAEGDGLAAAFEQVSRAPKQEQVLLKLRELLRKGEQKEERAFREELGVSAGVLRSMEKKGLIYRDKVPVSRLNDLAHQRRDTAGLTPQQEEVFAKMQEFLAENPGKPALLHGVTGSGKTLLFVKLIREALERGQQAVYLLPEIGLTQQVIDRLRSAFGEVVGVYHSRFSPHERVEIWQKVLMGEYQVVIGVRSALFLPFEDLGLIVIDEEHDSSLKQSEPEPRYNARDVAVWMGANYQIPVVLGSATPALETYANAQKGKYGLFTLKTRALPSWQMPDIRFVDLAHEYRHRLSHGEFSSVLLEEMRATLQREEQVILFKNRRGYAPFLLCPNCGDVPRCPSCDISLTYHKLENYIRCHYCGYTDHNTTKCNVCGHEGFVQKGIGTEQMEEQLNQLFPEYTIGRMDQDTMRGKQAFRQLIHRFETGEIQILVGTQMVTKGLDFPRVSLVAVTDVDRLLNWPDFRAEENAYQLLTQFAGRAGRSDRKSQFIIQGRRPDHPLLKRLHGPYEDFYSYERQQRKSAYYPPFCRLVAVQFRHKNRSTLEQEAQKVARLLRAEFSIVLGPEFPQVARIRNLYRMNLLIKLPLSASPKMVRDKLRRQIEAYYNQADSRSMRVLVDIDPR